jgi:hypothetical protein
MRLPISQKFRLPLRASLSWRCILRQLIHHRCDYLEMDKFFSTLFTMNCPYYLYPCS